MSTPSLEDHALPAAASPVRRCPVVLASVCVGLALTIMPLGAASARPSLGPVNSFVGVATFDVSGAGEHLVVEDGVRIEKFEGMAILENGRVIVSTDNDGNGETRLYRFGRLFE